MGAETHARRPSVHLAGACALAGILALAGAALAVGLRTPADERTPASAAQVNASLARGVAWVWPTSNGPEATREAAVLVESLVLREHHVERGGRSQPLILPGNRRLVPVLHIEAAADAPAEFTPAQTRSLLAAVRRHADAAAAAGLLQIDFEAPPRQREAYRALMASIRQALPADVRLSVTALAHWCTQGDWLDRLPVDEVVPMLYRLGPHADDWRRRFVQGDSTLARRCRGPALGFATNDPPPAVLLARTARPYWFDESAWSNPSRPPRHFVP